MKQFRILAIESSCDETAAAVILGDGKNPPSIVSSIVSSQIDLHAKTGGVVPEVASRAHVEAIIPVVTEALLKAKNGSHPLVSNKKKNIVRVERELNNNGTMKQWNNDYQEAVDYLKSKIDYLAVTTGPGLIGSLLVGFNAAKTLAYALDKPILPINHIEGHIYSALAEKIRNPKSEIRNKSQIQNTKAKTVGHSERSEESGEAGKAVLHDTYYMVREFEFPVLALVVSGGHTSLIFMRNHGEYELIGQTLDDAAGEAFDKVAQLLGLGYPGGPAISKLAAEYRKKNSKTASQLVSKSAPDFHDAVQPSSCPDDKLVFPRPILNDGTFNFSFSGLKTAVLSEVKRRLQKPPCLHSDVGHSHNFPSPVLTGEGRGEGLPDLDKAEIATAFEDAAVDVLVTKTMRAVAKYNPKTVVLAGGVAANQHLRNTLTNAISKYCSRLGAENSNDITNQDVSLPSARSKSAGEYDINLLIPPLELCGDNAAMIGLAAYYNILNGKEKRWDEIDVDSNWEIG